MAQATRYRALPNLPLLKERPEARTLPEKFAREAFQANFGDYARRIKRHADADLRSGPARTGVVGAISKYVLGGLAA